MRGGRGKRIALGSGLLGCAVLAVAGIAARDRILEQYYLFKLDHPRGARIDHEEDDGLISRLGQLRSVRAVPRILKHLDVNTRDASLPKPCIKLCIGALASAGGPAIPQLVLA
jgi:hypothetical protein